MPYLSGLLGIHCLIGQFPLKPAICSSIVNHFPEEYELMRVSLILSKICQIGANVSVCERTSRVDASLGVETA